MPKIKMTRQEYGEITELKRYNKASDFLVARLMRMPYMDLRRGINYWRQNAINERAKKSS